MSHFSVTKKCYQNVCPFLMDCNVRMSHFSVTKNIIILKYVFILWGSCLGMGTYGEYNWCYDIFESKYHKSWTDHKIRLLTRMNVKKNIEISTKIFLSRKKIEFSESKSLKSWSDHKIRLLTWRNAKKTLKFRQNIVIEEKNWIFDFG